MQTMGQLLNSNSQAIAHLEMQVGQLESTISEREQGRLPSQPEPNPRNQNGKTSQENQVNQVNAIHSLRSGKQVDNKVDTPDTREDSSAEPVEPPNEQSTLQTQAPETDSAPNQMSIISRAPFSNRLRSNKQSKYLDRMLEVFKQVQVNIPLLDMIQ